MAAIFKMTADQSINTNHTYKHTQMWEYNLNNQTSS